MQSRSLTLLALLIDALGAAGYDVADGAGGTVHVARPPGLRVFDHPLSLVESFPAIGVFPDVEDPKHNTASGVMDRVLATCIESAVRIGRETGPDGFERDTPGHVALDPLRVWVIVSVSANQVLQAAIRELPQEGRTTWLEADDQAGIAKCVQRFNLVHRTAYGNPMLKRS